MEIQKWEYKILQQLSAQQEPRLNELGAKGWELNSALGHHVVDEALVLILKRPAQLPSDIVFTSDLKKTKRTRSPKVMLRHSGCYHVRRCRRCRGFSLATRLAGYMPHCMALPLGANPCDIHRRSK